MKTVVITGSARGFGLSLAKEFRKNDFNVVITDINEQELVKGKKELEIINSKASITDIVMDVTQDKDIISLINRVIKKYLKIDIWINNAGVNQPNKPIWELTNEEITKLLDIDLKGSISCSKLIMPIMMNQKFGQIYNVEGHGSNDATILGLSLYGTCKRAITYFTESLAYENKALNTNILIGKITPGIMITNFIHTSLGDGESINLDNKTKKIYNILGDYPETIAHYIVPKIINNNKNGVKIAWLTNTRAFKKFVTYMFTKQNYFK